MFDLKIYLKYLLISTLILFVNLELLNNQFNSSLLMAASGSALANLLPINKILKENENNNLITSENNKKDYKLTAKNITLSIPELHYSSSNGLIELSSINITADYLEVETSDKQSLDDSNKFYEYPELVSSLNKTINPCHDFYEFVCHGWKQNNPIDGDKTSSNQFQLISNLIEQREKEILDDRQNFVSFPPYDKMMFNLYDSCMDSANRLKMGSSLLIQKMRKLKQRRNMRYITDWLINVWPVNLFYQIGVGPDMRNTSSNIITISPNNVFLMSEKLYLEENMAPTYLSALKNYLNQILELLYKDDTDQLIFKKLNKKEGIIRRVNSFIQVELLMAKIINETDKHYDNAYFDDQYLILNKFQKNLAGTINWLRYLQNTIPQQILIKKFPNGLANVEVRISEVTLIKKFDRLAQNLSGQVLSDYMDWKLILSEVTNLDDRFLDVGFELDRVLQGSTERAAHWKECKNVLINVFPALIERVYIKRYMNVNATKLQIEEMFQNVKKEFYIMLDKNKWMDEKTKIEAFQKLKKLKVLIGYMDNIFNETKLKKIYSEFSILPGQSFSEAMTFLNILLTQKAFYQLLEPVEVEFNSLGINGFYYPIKNVIVLTGGILQGVFFNSTTRPISMNYGSIGVVLAHEITHGFDNNGRLHDEFGNVRNWWKKETTLSFQKQKNCFIKQYNDIIVNELDGLHINGNMTQGENIADNGGMRAAYNAMKISLEFNQVAAQQKILGLEEFSAEQMFFINYAFSWCTNQRPEAAVFGAVYDVHSPPEARVNVVLSNMPQFSNNFNCPVGTPMNPKNKCQVW